MVWKNFKNIMNNEINYKWQILYKYHLYEAIKLVKNHMGEKLG